MPAAIALNAMRVPVPAETTLVTAAVLAAHGRMDIAVVIASLAGADRMPRRRFVVWNALGAAAWATSAGLTAYAPGSTG